MVERINLGDGSNPKTKSRVIMYSPVPFEIVDLIDFTSGMVAVVEQDHRTELRQFQGRHVASESVGNAGFGNKATLEFSVVRLGQGKHGNKRVSLDESIPE
jgi:hypothetical protein